ncbi:MAG: methyltransferase domain-containing protein [bacterium]
MDTVDNVALRLVRRLLGLPFVLFVRRLRSDSTLGLTPNEADALQSIRLAGGSIYGDRFRELCAFWNVRSLECFLFLARNGWPFSRRLRDTLMAGFDGNTAPGKLGTAYDRLAFHYSVQLMLSMHRGQWLVPFLSDIRYFLPDVKNSRVLDYGCGVSDMGLILAKMGAIVTIADLDNRKLDFTEWRYKRRSLVCQRLGVEDTETIPDLAAASFDLVIATEILEHVRDPLALLKRFSA